MKSNLSSIKREKPAKQTRPDSNTSEGQYREGPTPSHRLQVKPTVQLHPGPVSQHTSGSLHG
ncbi:hypothetical protein E2C01_060737 [Portunus trituberculatus]|uniref:Uncharacterized protein n=1 Tax=Portunus trituberculatus TaxID=210409 RepID=A0A5B7HCA6_PORTR|nr:hypothetical protein [Portunus trituberculatus]